MRFEFTLTGKTALLMHSDDVEWSDEMSAWRIDSANAKKKGESSGDDRRPAWTWVGYCYHDGAHIAIPSSNLQSCMSKAGARVPLGRQKTFKEIAVSGLFFEDEYLTFTNGGKAIPVGPVHTLKDVGEFGKHKKTVDAMGFRLDIRRACVGQSKHVRVRPRFDEWAASGVVEVTDERIDAVVLNDLFTQAGRCGLGDWRPSAPKKPGVFGMFSHTLKKAK